jgi:transposase
VAGVPARTAADLVGLNRRTAIHFYHRLRTIIAQQIEEEWAFTRAIEVDESYFGGRRSGRRKGKRGRGAAGKVPVFGILQRGGKVCTQVIPDAKSHTLLPIIREKIVPDSIYRLLPLLQCLGYVGV